MKVSIFSYAVTLGGSDDIVEWRTTPLQIRREQAAKQHTTDTMKPKNSDNDKGYERSILVQTKLTFEKINK